MSSNKNVKKVVDGNTIDSPVINHFMQSKGVRWYEVQFAGVRIGYAKNERSIQKKGGKILYQLSEEKELWLQILGTTNNISTKEEKQFSSIPPYPLLTYSYRDYSSGFSLKIKRIGEGTYEYSLQYNNHKKSNRLTEQYFTLSDELDMEMWVRTKPKRGESVSFSCLTIEAPEMQSISAKVQDIRHSEVNQTMVYDVMTTLQNESFNHFNFDETGNLLFMSGPSQFTYQHKSYKPLLPTGNSKDIYTNNIIPIDKEIGKIDMIKELELSLTGPNVHLLESSAGQRITCENQGHCYVTLSATSLPGNTINSETEAIDTHFTQITSRMLPEEKTIKSLAEKAIEGVHNPESQIEKLVSFVDKYLEDAYVFDTNLSELLNNKKGDCTEHAFLFMALARSLGIPCREVTGVIYIGDWCKGFGLHAWNEVFIAGRWLAVDTTRSSMKIKPVYIRFPDDPYKSSLLTESARDITIALSKVSHLD